jgi:pilus assembly protein Flp/PilA
MQEIPDPAQREHPLEEENGQGLAEYALILSLIAVVAIAALIFLGSAINDLMVVIGSTIESAT